MRTHYYEKPIRSFFLGKIPILFCRIMISMKILSLLVVICFACVVAGACLCCSAFFFLSVLLGDVLYGGKVCASHCLVGLKLVKCLD